MGQSGNGVTLVERQADGAFLPQRPAHLGRIIEDAPTEFDVWDELLTLAGRRRLSLAVCFAGDGVRISSLCLIL